MSSGVYLFTGPDRYRKRERVEALAQTLNAHPLDRHDASAVTLSAKTLMALVREHPAASPVRLIVVDEANRLDGACLKALEEHTERLKQTACLILLVDVDLPAAHPLTGFKTTATMEHFAWLSAPEAGQWVTRSLAAQAKTITPEALQHLLQAYGANLEGLHAILDQLIDWAGSRHEVTQDDVRQFLPAPSFAGTGPSRGIAFGEATRQKADGFALLEAVGRRDVGHAWRAVEEQLEAGKEVLELLGLLAWQLQRWLTVAHLVEAGVSRERIERLIGLRPWQADRLLAQVRDRPVASLQRALQQCWEVDVAAKTGRTLPRVALEALLAQLCLPSPRSTASRAA